MARVSIDGASSSSASSSRDPGKSTGSASKKSSGAGLDKAQKIKAAVAVGIIVLAGLFIAWNSGLFEGRPRVDANAPPDATPEETAAFEEAQKAAEQQPRSSGSTRLPPMPLGSN
jgi:hypothetical protein